MSAQAQADNDRFIPMEEAMTDAERREYEEWLDAVYWQTRADEMKEEGVF